MFTKARDAGIKLDMLCLAKFMLATLFHCPAGYQAKCFLAAIVMLYFRGLFVEIAEEIGNDITKTKPSRKFAGFESDLNAVASSTVLLVSLYPLDQ